jgi:hypothetical protein
VYVTATEFDFFTRFSRIWLVSCKNDLSACSSPIIISDSDTATQFSHVSVRPDGRVTVTYVNVAAFFPRPPVFDIKYVTCDPADAPSTPSCSPPKLVFRETQPLRFGGFLAAQDFRIATYPKHDHQVGGSGIETYVVWDRCKVPLFLGFVCPDADVVLAASNDDGATWSPMDVNTDPKDQFFPWVKTDRSTNIVNISYYTAEGDFFGHRVQVVLNHILPGPNTPNPIDDTHILTTLLDETSADPVLGGFFFGDYIGLAARGTGIAGACRAYAHFTYNTRLGVYNGVPNPQQDNNLSRLDY